MNTESVFVSAIGLTGVGILAWCWRTLQNPPKAPSVDDHRRRMTEEEEKIACNKVIADLKQRHKINSQLEEMEKRKKEAAKAAEKEKQEMVSFYNRDIDRFYVERIKGKPFFTGPTMDAVLSLLSILDRSGDAPSVVREHPNDGDGALLDTSYDLLHRIPLYKHSLYTAEEVIKRLDAGCPTVPKSVIAALAHDLGKLPEHYGGQSYKSAEHALIGAMALNEIPAIKNLPYYETVWEAVRGHHTTSTDKFVSLIREADQSARRRELIEAASAVIVV